MIAESFERTRPSEESVALLRADFRNSVANDVVMAPDASEAGTSDVEILDAETPRERYFRLRDEIRNLVASGDLEGGLERAEEAVEVARSVEDQILVALAQTNVAAIALELGRYESHLSDLRSILMRNFNADTSFAAAYQLSRACELNGDPKKCLFYARIAGHRAEEAKSSDYLAKSRVMMGGALLADSHFSQAESCLEEILTEVPEGLGEIALMARQNLGYCKVILGKLDEGFGILFAALRDLRRRDRPIFEASVRAALGLAYLEKGRLRRAWLHAHRALELSEAMGHTAAIKKCLYLLGEIEACAGDGEGAFEWFQEIQRRFYPEYDEIPGLMAKVGTLQLVNFGA